jgi:hypothetical protein
MSAMGGKRTLDKIQNARPYRLLKWQIVVPNQRRRMPFGFGDGAHAPTQGVFAPPVAQIGGHEYA